MDSTGAVDTLTVILSEPVEFAHYPSPTNDSERMVFRQLLPTLVRLDCEGRLRPGLALAWSRSTETNAWILRLGNRTRFAPAVPRESRQIAATLRSEGRPLGIDSALELDQDRIWVRIYPGPDTLPRLLADPSLGMLTGLAQDSGSADGGDIESSYGGPVVRFQVAPNGDPRDAIDRGVDLAVTRDPAVVSYVRGRPDLVVYPLPWNRTYVLLQPSATDPLRLGNLDSLRRSLAHDAIRSEARPAALPLWTDSLASCGGSSPDRPQQRPWRVVYLRYDAAARGLAERIVALSDDPGVSAAALDPTEFDHALRSGNERAYIVAVPRRTLSPCREAGTWPANSILTPLVDTRAHAIVRRGSPALTVDWEGTVVPEDSL